MKIKNAVLLTCLMFPVYFMAYSQQAPSDKISMYDSTLAAKLGADEYGMKTYYFVFLRKGDKTVSDSVEEMKIQNGHLKNISRLADQKKIVLAGPFMDDQDIRGIFIFNAGSVEEVDKYLKSDPAIQAGLLSAEIHPWYGSAALMEVVPIHKVIQKTSFVK